MGTIKKTIHILSNVAYIAVLLYILVALPIFFGYKPLVVLSGSMEPTYKVGSVIYYEENNRDIKEKDIIVFESGNSAFVTHRVKKVQGTKLVTKGDANNSEDPAPVDINSVKGKALNISIPLVGYYIQYVNTNPGLVLVIVFILISEFLLSNVGVKKKDKEISALEGGSNKDE